MTIVTLMPWSQEKSTSPVLNWLSQKPVGVPLAFPVPRYACSPLPIALAPGATPLELAAIGRAPGSVGFLRTLFVLLLSWRQYIKQGSL